jgi:hypothetical protein
MKQGRDGHHHAMNSDNARRRMGTSGSSALQERGLVDDYPRRAISQSSVNSEKEGVSVSGECHGHRSLNVARQLPDHCT